MDAKQHFNKSSKCTLYDVGNGQTQWLAKGNTTLGISIMRTLFGLGITEYHEESMCLFQFQLGQFNKKRCNYKYISKMKVDGSSRIWSSNKTHHRFENEPGMREMLLHYSTKDMVLWTEAMKIFAQRIRYVENEMNVQIIDSNDLFWKNFDVPAPPKKRAKFGDDPLFHKHKPAGRKRDRFKDVEIFQE